MSIKGQDHSLTLVKGHSDFKVKCLTFGLYTHVSDSGPLDPLLIIIIIISNSMFIIAAGCFFGGLHQFIRCNSLWGGRVVRWCWVNFQCRGVLLIRIRVGQGPTALAVGAGGVCVVHFFSHLSFLFSFSLSLGDGPI